jgi:hypothetical protein
VDTDTVTITYTTPTKPVVPPELARLGFRSMDSNQFMKDQSRTIDGVIQSWKNRSGSLAMKAYRRTASSRGLGALVHKRLGKSLGPGLSFLLDLTKKDKS